MSELFNLLKFRLVWLNFLIVLILTILIFFNLIFIPLHYLFLTNLFDIFGYFIVLTRKGSSHPVREVETSYRVVQVLFDTSLIIIYAITFTWQIAFISAVLKFFALQDLLYYIFLRIPFPASWNWLGFTPLGLFKKKFNIQRSAGSGIHRNFIFNNFVLFIFIK